MNTEIDVSVIIPVFQDAEGLRATLKALTVQTYPHHRFEVLVADNNSPESLQTIVNEFQDQSFAVHYLLAAGDRGAGAARNAAVPLAKGEILAFTDANCIPRDNWLETGMQCLLTQKVDRVAGEIMVEPISPQSPAAALLSTVRHLYQKELYDKYGAAATANLFLKKACLEQLGGFHHNFLEDVELGLRAEAAGFTIAYNPNCCVSHAPRSTFGSVWYKGTKHGRGTYAICASRPDWAGRWGWKHVVRPLKMLVRPYELFWERLPFPKQVLSGQKLLIVHVLAWLVVNVAEAWGYTEWATRAALGGRHHDS